MTDLDDLRGRVEFALVELPRTLRKSERAYEALDELVHRCRKAEARVKELEARGVIDDRDYQAVHQRAQQAEAEVKRLRSALEDIASWWERVEQDPAVIPEDIARAALKEQADD